MLGRWDSENEQKQAITEALLYSRSAGGKVQIIFIGKKFFSVGTAVIPGPCEWPSFSRQGSPVWSPVRFEFFGLMYSPGRQSTWESLQQGGPGLGAGLESDLKSQSLENVSDWGLSVESWIYNMSC